jgi:hypothetical protein
MEQSGHQDRCADISLAPPLRQLAQVEIDVLQVYAFDRRKCHKALSLPRTSVAPVLRVRERW